MIPIEKTTIATLGGADNQTGKKELFSETAETKIVTKKSSIVINVPDISPMEIPCELFGQIRMVKTVAIGECLNPMTVSRESYWLFVFRTPSQSQAWAKRLKRGCHQTLTVGEQCEQIVIITPSLDSDEPNDVKYLGEWPKEILFLKFLMPTESIDDICGKLNKRFEWIFP
jgi:hypothetical protein